MLQVSILKLGWVFCELRPTISIFKKMMLHIIWASLTFPIHLTRTLILTPWVAFYNGPYLRAPPRSLAIGPTQYSWLSIVPSYAVKTKQKWTWGELSHIIEWTHMGMQRKSHWKLRAWKDNPTCMHGWMEVCNNVIIDGWPLGGGLKSLFEVI